MNWLAYIKAWLSYGSKLLEAAAGIIDVWNNSIAGLHVPKKQDYEG